MTTFSPPSLALTLDAPRKEAGAVKGGGMSRKDEHTPANEIGNGTPRSPDVAEAVGQLKRIVELLVLDDQSTWPDRNPFDSPVPMEVFRLMLQVVRAPGDPKPTLHRIIEEAMEAMNGHDDSRCRQTYREQLEHDARRLLALRECLLNMLSAQSAGGRNTSGNSRER